MTSIPAVSCPPETFLGLTMFPAVADNCGLISMLWAVTSYFNPAGYQHRLSNYREFRRRLSAPLVTVELSFGGPFELRSGDADILVQVRGGDVLWQKERLLNIAVQAVPGNAVAIAWVDCDTIFDSEDWPRRALQALENCPLVHLFHERHDLPEGVAPGELSAWKAPCTSESAVRKMLAGRAVPEDFSFAGAPLAGRSTLGLAWATHRDIANRHGLYDACILGSGDRAILCGAIGRFDWGASALKMNATWYEHYLGWARPYFDSVRGRIGYIEGRVFHLWHGDLRLRKYSERLDHLHTFDPFTDIALDDSGAWRWNSAKPDLHRFVHEYFLSRQEDGCSGCHPHQY